MDNTVDLESVVAGERRQVDDGGSCRASEHDLHSARVVEVIEIQARAGHNHIIDTVCIYVAQRPNVSRSETGSVYKVMQSDSVGSSHVRRQPKDCRKSSLPAENDIRLPASAAVARRTRGQCQDGQIINAVVVEIPSGLRHRSPRIRTAHLSMVVGRP